MADSISIDPQAIMRAGDGITSAAGRIQDEVDAFQAELDGFGEPWGTDDLGSLIGVAYQTIAGLAMECYGQNGSDLADMGAATQMMATNYQDTEQANTDQANTDQLDRYREILG